MLSWPAHLRSIVDHDGAVILDIPRNATTRLDAVGSYVWDRVQRDIEVGAIVRELARDTGTDTSVVTKDVEQFMEQLKSRHLVNPS